MILIALTLALTLQTQKPPAPKPTLEQRLQELEETVNTLWESHLELYGDRAQRRAVVNCDTGHYSEARPESTDLTFFVACEKIEAYLEGFKVTIAIGNPYVMSFTDIEGTLFYGETFAIAIKQKASFSFTSLPSGIWSKTTITLNPVTAKNLRTVMLQFKVKRAVAR